MWLDVIRLTGWLGLFLLGLTVLTEGLRALAGDAASRILYRFTRNPVSGAATGAVATAIVQSSSAITVATIGFVGAGMLSFPQALGIIWGANLGTTLRGWLVALLGFKFSFAPAMLLALFAGTLMRLFGSRRLRDAGWALAGFALIFVAIDQMRAAMEPLRDVVAPQSFPGDGAGGRAILVGIGFLVTLVTQSSGAGVALALTALNAGTIGFSQAAAMVIGMDVGTTSTSAFATLGGSPQVKRTGFSHVVFNVCTAAGAFLLLPLFVAVVDARLPHAIRDNPELTLVAFHTTFNLLGVLAVLPFTGRFAAMMCRLIPDTEPSLTQRLDPVLARDRSAATLAVWLTIQDIAGAAFADLRAALSGDGDGPIADSRWDRLERAIGETRRFADDAWSSPPTAATEPFRQPIAHCLDHLSRMARRGRQRGRGATVMTEPQLAAQARCLRDCLALPPEEWDAARLFAAAQGLREVRDALADLEPALRQRMLDAVGAEMHFDDAVARLAAARWLRRSAYHAWRIAHHLHAALCAGTDGSRTPPAGDPVDGAELPA